MDPKYQSIMQSWSCKKELSILHCCTDYIKNNRLYPGSYILIPFELYIRRLPMSVISTRFLVQRLSDFRTAGLPSCITRGESSHRGRGRPERCDAEPHVLARCTQEALAIGASIYLKSHDHGRIRYIYTENSWPHWHGGITRGSSTSPFVLKKAMGFVSIFHEVVQTERII